MYIKDVNRIQTFWCTDTKPIPTWYLVFQSQCFWYCVGYERASIAREAKSFNITQKSQYERPGPALPETLLRGFYLSNRWVDWPAVFFAGYPHSSCQVLDYCRCMWVTPNARATCKIKGCQFDNNYDDSVITGPIMLKLRMHVGTHLAVHFHVSQLACYRTCARGRHRSF